MRTLTVRSLLQVSCLAACLNPAWAGTTLEFSTIRQPSTVFIVGPGTVVSVRMLDVPFVAPRCVVKYRTDDGEMIEVWHPGKDIPVVEGMHGMLTYSTHPEMVISFRTLTQKVPK